MTSNDSERHEKGVSQESVSAEEIREYEEENGEPHPVFEVKHRPERRTVAGFDEPVGYCHDCEEKIDPDYIALENECPECGGENVGTY